MKLPTERNVTVIAITIPIIPNKFPCLEVSGEDKPLRAKINNTPEIKYKIAERFADINYFSFFFAPGCLDFAEMPLSTAHAWETLDVVLKTLKRSAKKRKREREGGGIPSSGRA